MIVIGGAALLFFGPDQLPSVARKVGSVVRELQLTSQTFIREMERAADEADTAKMTASTPLDVEEIPVEHVDDPTPAYEPFDAESDEDGAEAPGTGPAASATPEVRPLKD